MAGSCSSSAVAQFMQLRIVSDYSFHATSVRLSLLPVNDGMRPAGYLPPPVQRGTPAHPAKHNKLGQLQAVAQRLRPMIVIGNWKVP